MIFGGPIPNTSVKYPIFHVKDMNKCRCFYNMFVYYDCLRLSQYFFGHVGVGLRGLNQY